MCSQFEYTAYFFRTQICFCVVGSFGYDIAFSCFPMYILFKRKNRVNIGNYTQHGNTQKAHKLKYPPATLSSLYIPLQCSFQTCIFSQHSNSLKSIGHTTEVHVQVTEGWVLPKQSVLHLTEFAEPSALEAVLWVLFQRLLPFLCLSFLFTSLSWENWFSIKVLYGTLKQTRDHAPNQQGDERNMA